MTPSERLAQWADEVERTHENYCLCLTLRLQEKCAAIQGVRIVRAMLARGLERSSFRKVDRMFEAGAASLEYK